MWHQLILPTMMVVSAVSVRLISRTKPFLHGVLILQPMMPPLHENRIWSCETNDLLTSVYHMSEFTHEHCLACVACVLEISKLAHKFYSRHTGGHKCNCKLSLELYHNYIPLIFTTLLVIQFQPIGFDI